MKVTRTSQFSGITRTLDLNIADDHLTRMAKGEHIQNVLTHLSDGEREFILTGITDEEWDEMFKDYEEQ